MDTNLEKIKITNNLNAFKFKENYIVINSNCPRLIIVDEEALDVLRHMSTVRNRTLVYNQLKQKYNENDLNMAISYIEQSRILDNNCQTTRVPIRLKSIYFMITHACNLRCPHCYVSAGKQLPNELADNEILKVLEDALDLGLEFLILSGGEPLIRRKLVYKVAEWAWINNIDLTVETNGTLITSNDIETFKKYGVSVGVSLDGDNEKINDAIRGAGTFRKITSNIRKLVSEGIEVTVGFTVMKPNVNRVKSFINLLAELGVKKVDVNKLFIVGRAKENKELINISEKEFVEAVIKMYEQGKLKNINVSFESFLNKISSEHVLEFCGAGRSFLSITPTGDVYPCFSFYAYGIYKAGNLRENSLKEIWENSPVLKEIRDFRLDAIPACKSCSLRSICGGGCLAELLKNGKKISEIKTCSIYLKNLYWGLIKHFAEKAIES